MASAAAGGKGGKDGFLGELRDAVSLRAALLVLGVLALQLAFVTSYLGAFHNPTPDKVPIAVVAPQQVQDEYTQRLDTLPGTPLKVRTATDDEAEAVQQIKNRKIDGALVVDPAGTTDRLLVASGAGASLSQALEQVIRAVQQAQQRLVEVEDVVPVEKGDARGLSSFYLVVGWSVGGYLIAAILAMSYGARPINLSRALIRLGALAVYAIVAGLGGALIAGPVLGALPGNPLALWGLGALIVFAVGAATLALQGMAGVIGIGVAILLVVVLGNPSAGGAYPGPLLPPFWRTIGPAFPPGAGTWSARSIAYFDGAAITGPLLVLAAWAVAGLALTLLFAVLRGRGQNAAGARTP
ncbi:ABC transporter permease [Streptomyces gobiensis]|uniref:ABC transporter permease n=1 Tax=Streptomyces gobiensis TaxID=2875706 RepID=UPI001E2E1480|nr:ABC transporter permease [Streptomyces gobiensis]UGY92664.1 ABC transporter permease [Streptomyces gobiensis]